jgi:hypothetical protein
LPSKPVGRFDQTKEEEEKTQSEDERGEGHETSP